MVGMGITGVPTEHTTKKYGKYYYLQLIMHRNKTVCKMEFY